MDPCFNLVDERWICLMTEDGEEEMLSLRETLLHAQNYRCLAGETPLQNVALLRLLLAVLHSCAFPEEALETPEEAVSAWVELWEAGEFPAERVEAYLQQWHERFWLFHAERPFLQVIRGLDGMTAETAAEASGLKKAKGKPAKGVQTASKLNGAVFESGNKEKLFNIATGEEKDSLSFPEAARWLVHVVGYDDGGIKSYFPKNTEMNRSDERAGCTVSWLGGISPVYAEGTTLFETLMLNLILLKDGEMTQEALWPPQRPTWEYPEAPVAESLGRAIPDNPAELYTCLVFPAYAGVIPEANRTLPGLGRFPRIRGGDPEPPPLQACVPLFSPHTRG